MTSSWPAKSSIEHPARPAAPASVTVSATPAGSSAKPFSVSAAIGTSTAAASAAPWPVTVPSDPPNEAGSRVEGAHVLLGGGVEAVPDVDHGDRDQQRGEGLLV